MGGRRHCGNAQPIVRVSRRRRGRGEECVVQGGGKDRIATKKYCGSANPTHLYMHAHAHHTRTHVHTCVHTHTVSLSQWNWLLLHKCLTCRFSPGEDRNRPPAVTQPWEDQPVCDIETGKLIRVCTHIHLQTMVEGLYQPLPLPPPSSMKLLGN